MRTCSPAVAPPEQVGVGHVVRAVADVGEAQAGQRAEPLADRQQIRQDLAGVVAVGQGVDDRHPGVLRHLRQGRLGEGPPDDGGGLPAEHPGGVGHRLARHRSRPAGRPPSSGSRRARRCRPRTSSGSAGSACRTARRCSADPRTACTPYGSAFSCAARARTWACSAGLRSSSARKCLIIAPLPSSRRVQQLGQDGDEPVQLLGGDDQGRGEPEHVRPRRVDDEAGVQGGIGHLRRPPARPGSRHAAGPRPRTPVIIG